MQPKSPRQSPFGTNAWRLCQRACCSLWHHVSASDYNAKVLLLFVLYVVVLVCALPESIAYLVFIPFMKLVMYFAENFIGIMVLFLAFILSDRFKILRHYMLLFLLYLACAYPSLQLGGEIFPVQWFLSIALEPLSLLKSSDYVMLFAYYGKGIVWVFLAFAVFDLVFALLQSRNFLEKSSKSHSDKFKAKIPRLIYENLTFALVLYGAVFGIYSYDGGTIVLY